MSFDLILILVGTTFIAAFATGAAGFGDALVTLSIWLFFMSPQEAVPLVVACGAAISIYSLILLGRRLDYSKLPVFAVAGTLGVPLGVWLLTFLDPGLFRTIMGGFLVVYSSFFLLTRALPTVAGGGMAVDGAVGLVGGVMGGFAGLSGVVPTLWCGLRGWPRHTQRGTFQGLLVVMHIITLVSLFYAGLLTVETGARLLWCLPALVAGVWLGLKIYARLDEVLFRRVVLGILLVSGITLLFSGGNPNG